MGNRSWQIDCGELRITFQQEKGPMPHTVSVKRFDGSYLPVIVNEKTNFSVTDGEGNIYHPALTAEPSFFEENGATCVLFNNLCFINQNGEIDKYFTGTFMYEVYPDGTTFTNCFFLSNRADKCTLQDLKLSLNTDVSTFDDTRYGILHRPAKIDGATIQDLSPKRFVERNTPQNLPEILPLATFNNFKNHGEDLYFEFFMECGTTLSGNTDENATILSWENDSPCIEWNFQTVPAVKDHLAFQFRNRWGWVICSPERIRKSPPFTMYHYLDNTVRYPSDAVISSLHKSGCDVLIIHENWRLDIQNDGFPYNEKRLKEVISLAHSYGIRVALYMRGAELSSIEQACSWFNRYLIHNYDGLYMDYGGALTHTYAPGENFTDGRTGFRQHYMKLRALRETVGEKGLFYSHTGAHYTALGMRFTDGYVSGEGEKGMLLRGRKEYGYFSMAMVSSGTLWSAAFPEYSTEKIVPFIASAGQYPHSALGEQFISSSLVHPKEPGINDHCFRPLWKLWKLFKEERNIAVFNDFNSENVFAADELTGHYLMISGDHRRALLIVSNFSSENRRIDCTPAWELLPFDPAGKKVYRLVPDENSPGIPQEYNESKLIMELEKHCCAGFYFSADEPDFTGFCQSYHQPCAPEGLAWQQEITLQRQLRNDPPMWDKVLLQMEIADMPAFSYEDSMTVDLFDNDSWVVKFNVDGSFEKLFPILNDSGKALTTGESSVTVDLSKYLAPGRHHIGVYATHLGEPFYSFFTAKLSDGNKNSYDVVFRNDLEGNRALLHFDVIIP